MKAITIYTAFMLFILISILFFENNINTRVNKDNIIFEMSILKTENMEEFDLTPINIKSAGFLFLWGCTLIVIIAYFWNCSNTKTNNL